MNEIYQINDAIVIIPEHKEKPLRQEEVEFALETLYKSGVINGGTYKAGKVVLEPEQEKKRRERVWNDLCVAFGNTLIGEGPEIGVMHNSLPCNFAKAAFIKDPVAYTKEQMDDLVRLAEEARDRTVKFIERTMKAYGPDGKTG